MDNIYPPNAGDTDDNIGSSETAYAEFLRHRYLVNSHKHGSPELDVLLGIMANTSNPIKVDAPPTDTGHWRQTDSVTGIGFWREDPIQTDAPIGVHSVRYNGTWVEGIDKATYDNEQLAQDNAIKDRLRPRGLWQAGVTDYRRNDEVLDDGWLADCLVDGTLERPAPQEIGGNIALFPDGHSFEVEQYLGVVHSGTEITFEESTLVKAFQLQVPELSDDTNYKYVVAIEHPNGDVEASIHPEPLLRVGQWATIDIGERMFTAGTRVIVYIDALTSADITPVTGGWNYIGDTNVALIAGEWSRDKDNWIRIHRFDADGTDRLNELMGMIPNTTILFNETGNPANFRKWRVDANPTQVGDEIRFEDIAKDSDGGAGNNLGDPVLTTMNAEVPIPLETRYVETVDYWVANQPTFATCRGYLKFGANSHVYNNNGYGVNIIGVRVNVSDDWSLKAFYGNSGVGAEEVVVEPVAIVYGQSNTQNTVTDDDPANMTLAQINTLSSPEGFEGNWTFDAATARLTYNGEGTKAFKTIWSGNLGTDSTRNTDHFYVQLSEAAGVMTGSDKRYPSGRSNGPTTSDVSFTCIAFGVFSTGDFIQLEMGKDFSGSSILTSVMIEVEPV